MSSRRRPAPIVLFLVALGFSIACASPPTQEMDQAQGAIDAARAAGADRYAAAEYEAAVKSLEQARTAVTERDYRLALNYALDSRSRAQIAAKEAAAEQAELRSAAERRLGEVTALLDRAKQSLAAANAAHAPRAALAPPREAIEAAETSVQKAGTAIQEADYKASQELLEESARNLEAAIAKIETAQKGRRPARR